MSVEVSRYYSEDRVKEAVILDHGDRFTVECFENGQLLTSIDLVGKSIHYAEDTAENFVTEIFQYR